MSSNPVPFLPTIQPVANFQASSNTCLLACSTTSGSTALALPASTGNGKQSDVLIYNAGSVAAFIAFGSSSITAAIAVGGTPANGIPLAPGVEMTLNIGTATYVAGITGLSTASVYITQGIGS